MPIGIPHSYQLEQSISILRVAGWYFSFSFEFVWANSGDPDQMPDLGLHSLHTSHKKEASLIWVNKI